MLRRSLLCPLAFGVASVVPANRLNGCASRKCCRSHSRVNSCCVRSARPLRARERLTQRRDVGRHVLARRSPTDGGVSMTEPSGLPSGITQRERTERELLRHKTDPDEPDISARKQAEALLAGERRLLESLPRAVRLSTTLDALCRLAEDVDRGWLVSILLLDPKGKHVRTALVRAFRRATPPRSMAGRSAWESAPAPRRRISANKWSRWTSLRTNAGPASSERWRRRTDFVRAGLRRSSRRKDECWAPSPFIRANRRARHPGREAG